MSPRTNVCSETPQRTPFAHSFPIRNACPVVAHSGPLFIMGLSALFQLLVREYVESVPLGDKFSCGLRRTL